MGWDEISRLRVARLKTQRGLGIEEKGRGGWKELVEDMVLGMIGLNTRGGTLVWIRVAAKQGSKEGIFWE